VKEIHYPAIREGNPAGRANVAVFLKKAKSIQELLQTAALLI
jgi:hypothetical protein